MSNFEEQQKLYAAQRAQQQAQDAARRASRERQWTANNNRTQEYIDKLKDKK